MYAAYNVVRGTIRAADTRPPAAATQPRTAAAADGRRAPKLLVSSQVTGGRGGARSRPSPASRLCYSWCCAAMSPLPPLLRLAALHLTAGGTAVPCAAAGHPIGGGARPPPAAASFSLPRTYGAAWKPISVTDYGAAGDGISNDGPAIQRAIDDALLDGSLCVWFPPGDYVTNQTILASGSADRPTKSPVSLRGWGTAANTRILLRLASPPPARRSVVKFQGASMGASASICPEPAAAGSGFCAGCGVFSHTVVENLAIDANVTGDPLCNNTVGIEWAAVIGGIVRNCAIGLDGLEVGMLLHNNANGSFTEFCQAHDTVFGAITAVQYLISDVTSHVSFHGSGLLRAAIQGSRNPRVRFTRAVRTTCT
jgi:hypothetical protein